MPGFFEATVGALSSPASIALCIAARNASSIFSCVLRNDISSINSSSLILGASQLKIAERLDGAGALKLQLTGPATVLGGRSSAPPCRIAAALRSYRYAKSEDTFAEAKIALQIMQGTHA